MTMSEYLKGIQAKLGGMLSLNDEEAQALIGYIRDLEDLCDDSDGYDVHGEGGWRRRFEVDI